MYNSGGLSYGRVGGRKQELRNTKQIPKNLKRKGEMIMITKEQEIKNTLKAKGQLVKIDEEGLHIYDKKSEKVEILSLDDFKIFIESDISISVAESTKQDIEVVVDEEDEGGDNGEDSMEGMSDSEDE